MFFILRKIDPYSNFLIICADCKKLNKMEKRFLLILNSFSDHKFRTVTTALADASVNDISTAFDILAISQGIRDVGFVFGPGKDWVATEDMGVLSITPTRMRAKLVVNANKVSDETMRNIMRRYETDNGYIAEFGKLLGYIQPSTLQNSHKLDTRCEIRLVLPGKRNVPSQYGPQMLEMKPSNIRKIKEITEKFEVLAQTLHKEFFVTYVVYSESKRRNDFMQKVAQEKA